jgi:Protein of unknown function (DUF2510)
MYEFDSISVSSYEASSLAAKLTERSGDGWDVVAIVPAGSEITAYLRRGSSGSSESATAGDTAGAAAASSTSSWDTAGAGAVAASTPSEPAGWGTAPESTSTTSTPSSGGWGASAATAPATAPATPTSPSVPAGWYTDPAGRYDLRYWDGSAWTEHVSRAGQQSMDPPVA